MRNDLYELTCKAAMRSELYELTCKVARMAQTIEDEKAKDNLQNHTGGDHAEGERRRGDRHRGAQEGDRSRRKTG